MKSLLTFSIVMGLACTSSAVPPHAPDKHGTPESFIANQFHKAETEIKKHDDGVISHDLDDARKQEAAAKAERKAGNTKAEKEDLANEKKDINTAKKDKILEEKVEANLRKAEKDAEAAERAIEAAAKEQDEIK